MIKILTVDDAKTMRDIIKSTLENAGYAVDTAVDGDDGLAKAKATQYDMVLADLYMPERDGMKLLASLRVLDNYKSIPVLLITTEDSDRMKQKSKSLGANGWVTKPIDSTRLLTAVSKTLEKFQ